LSIHTMALHIEKDIAMPATLSYHIESGCFNLREIYAYNGDCCNKTTAKNLWWKKDYRTQGLTQGYVSAVDENTIDPFLESYKETSDVFWYGLENGVVYLSPSCATYSRLNMIFNGSLAVLGDFPTVPIELRKVTCDMVTLDCFKKLKARNPKLYTSLYRDAYVELYDKKDGSLIQAKVWCLSLDLKAKNDLMEYLSKANA
jgi:hypothetical protein